MVIVTFANKPRFTGGVKRMRDSLVKNDFKGQVIAFSNYSEIESPTHEQIPYAFKIYAIEKARAMGYKLILWLDSITYAIKPMSNLELYLASHEMILISGGFKVKEWTNKKVLRKWSKYAEENLIIGGCMGFNFNKERTNNLFEDIKRNINDFKGSWHDHRHDQSLISVLVAKHDIKLCPYQFVTYQYQTPNPLEETCLFFE